MLSRKNTLFCLDTTQKVQSPSRELAGPCAPISELAGLYRLSGGKSPVLRYFAEEKYYKHKPAEKRIPGTGGNWYDALEMYRATGETAYLDHAKKQADIYIEKFIRTQPEKFQNAFFWNRYAPFYINLLELYEETGERRYLEAAHEGAREYAMFVWMVPSIPQGDITVNQGGLAPWYWYLKSRGIPRQHCPEESVPAWRLSEIGLVPESSTTCIGHRAVFMAHHAPYMLRIADLTATGSSVTSPAAPSWDATPIFRVIISTPNARRLTRNQTFRCVRTTVSASTRSTTTTSSRCCPSCTTIW